MGGQVMGTPIKGKTYSMAPTPEGEEHPNIMVADLRKAAQQALEALDWINQYALAPRDICLPGEIESAVDAVRAALAQPEQAPVAWRYDEATYRPDDLRGRQWHFNLFSTHKPYADHMVQNVTPLYAHPPQRKPLTEEELKVMWDIIFEFARAIEAAHGIGGDHE